MKQRQKAYSIDVYLQVSDDEVKKFGTTTTNYHKAKNYYENWSNNPNVLNIEWEELD